MPWWKMSAAAIVVYCMVVQAWFIEAFVPRRVETFPSWVSHGRVSGGTRRETPYTAGVLSSSSSWSCVEEAFERTRKEVLSDSSDKEALVKLASLGVRYDSYLRNLDYLHPHTSLSSSTSASSPSSASAPPPSSSLWKRQAEDNVNVKGFLMAHGLSAQQADEEVAKEHWEAVRRVVNPAHRGSAAGQRMDTLRFDFHIQSSKGCALMDLCLPASGYAPSAQPYQSSQSSHPPDAARTESYWEGNTFVTDTYSNTTTPALLYTVRRRLFHHHHHHHDVRMHVNTTSFLPSNNSNHTALSCIQLYHRTYHSQLHSINTHSHSQPSDCPTLTLHASTPQRVPGCTSNVDIRTVLLPHTTTQTSSQTTNNNHHPSNYRLFLEGEADALLSRGILALLFRTLSDTNLTAEDVLALDPDQASDLAGLRTFLSKGRNDGMANIVRIVQQQIRSLLTNTNTNININDDTTDTNDDTTDTNDDTTDIDTLQQTPPMGTNPSQQQPTVAMLLSGGVDSSVALHLLLQQNYNVTAFYLRIWLEDEFAHLGKDACPWEDDYNVCQAVVQHARETTNKGGGGGVVQLETVSLQREYHDRVVGYTIEEAKRGRTPNPDIMCNSRVKFGCFYDAIQGRGFDYVASGHYAQLLRDTAIHHTDTNTDTDNEHSSATTTTTTTTTTQPSTHRPHVKLLRAPDPIKDQSYFLAALTQTQLRNVLFPIGHLHKHQVRSLANTLQLPNRDRPDSQGLCFLGKVKFDEFLSAYLTDDPGDVVDADTGDIVGRHRGLWFHTVGQRKGIGKALDPKAGCRGPWYVVAKDPRRKIVFVSNKYDGEAFHDARTGFYVEGLRWIAGRSPVMRRKGDGEGEEVTDTEETGGLRMTMKIRHGPTLVEGYLYLLDNNHDDEGDAEVGSTGRVVLDTKDGGLAPGQFVAFYEGMECLGSGIISERHWDAFREGIVNVGVEV